MIVDYFHAEGVAVEPSKAKPPLIIDANTVLAGAIAMQCFQSIARDAAKFELMGVLRWPDGSFQRPWRIGNPGEVGLLVEKLDELRSGCPVTVAMESSGTYGDAVRQGLSDARIEVHRVSDKAVKAPAGIGTTRT